MEALSHDILSRHIRYVHGFCGGNFKGVSEMLLIEILVPQFVRSPLPVPLMICDHRVSCEEVEPVNVFLVVSADGRQMKLDLRDVLFHDFFIDDDVSFDARFFRIHDLQKNPFIYIRSVIHYETPLLDALSEKYAPEETSA